MYRQVAAQKLHLSDSFLDVDPAAWHSCPEQDVMHQLHVTNDYAELGVALLQNYMAILTKQTELQNLLLVVAKHIMDYPNTANSQKATLAEKVSLSS